MKFTKLILLTITLGVFTQIKAFGQFGSPLLTYKNDVPTQKECAEITKRKLIVLNQRWDLDKVDKFKRDKEFSLLEEYKDECAAYSNAYVQLIKEKWSLHDTFEVYSFKQIKELYETGATDVVVLALVHITVEKGSDNKNEYKLDFAYSANEKKMDENGFNPQDFKSLILFPIEQLNELDYTFTKMYLGISLLRQVPTKEDIHYSIDMMNNIVQRKTLDNKFTDNTIKQLSPKLKEYTLAISKKDWDEDISIQDAQVYYPYPIEIVDQEKFNTLITEGATGYAYAFKLGTWMGIMFSDTKEIAYVSAPIDIPVKKATTLFSLRDLNKINEAVTNTKIVFKE